MKNLLLLTILLSLMLSACTPQRRLARLVKHHPELVKTDSAKVHGFVHENGIDLDTNFWINFKPDQDSGKTGIHKGKDSLNHIDHIFHFMDNKTGIHADVFQSGTQLNLKLHKDPQEIPVTLTVPVKKVQAVIKKGFTTVQVLGMILGGVILLFVIILLIGRKYGSR
jgi:hypothetical protein